MAYCKFDSAGTRGRTDSCCPHLPLSSKETDTLTSHAVGRYVLAWRNCWRCWAHACRAVRPGLCPVRRGYSSAVGSSETLRRIRSVSLRSEPDDSRRLFHSPGRSFAAPVSAAVCLVRFLRLCELPVYTIGRGKELAAEIWKHMLAIHRSCPSLVSTENGMAFSRDGQA